VKLPCGWIAKEGNELVKYILRPREVRDLVRVVESPILQHTWNGHRLDGEARINSIGC
jgi:hypothetical protein